MAYSDSPRRDDRGGNLVRAVRPTVEPLRKRKVGETGDDNSKLIAFSLSLFDNA